MINEFVGWELIFAYVLVASLISTGILEGLIFGLLSKTDKLFYVLVSTASMVVFGVLIFLVNHFYYLVGYFILRIFIIAIVYVRNRETDDFFFKFVGTQIISVVAFVVLLFLYQYIFFVIFPV